MASLAGQQLKDTYDSLLKVDDNGPLGGTYKEITDGLGNGSNLYLGTGGNVGIGTTSPSAGLHVEQSGTDVSIISRNTNNSASVATSSSLKLGITSTVGTHDGEIKVVEGAVNSNTTRMEFYNQFSGTSYKNMQILGNGDITFYDDTGVTPAFFWDASAESLGIGTTSPSEKLDVVGNVTISGSLSKGSGSFKIDHPLESKKDTHYLVHSFIESPQANNIYRGSVNLVDGKATVNLDEFNGMTDGTFVLLNTDIHVYTSNESDWDAVKGSVSDNVLTIECQNASSTAKVNWLVIGERHDRHMMESNWTDENGKVIVEPLKPIENDLEN